MSTTIGQPVKFKGKKIIAKKKNGGAASLPESKQLGIKASKTAAPKTPKLDTFNVKIEKEIEAGNFDACLGLDETTNVYVVAFDDGYHVAAIKKDRVIDLIGSRSGSDNDAYVTAINLGVAWIAKQ